VPLNLYDQKNQGTCGFVDLLKMAFMQRNKTNKDAGIPNIATMLAAPVCPEHESEQLNAAVMYNRPATKTMVSIKSKIMISVGSANSSLAGISCVFENPRLKDQFFMLPKKFPSPAINAPNIPVIKFSMM
jgi:hypothetical protein